MVVTTTLIMNPDTKAHHVMKPQDTKVQETKDMKALDTNNMKDLMKVTIDLL